MGQVLKDEQNHQVEMGAGGEFYQREQHEAKGVKKGLCSKDCKFGWDIRYANTHRWKPD